MTIKEKVNSENNFFTTLSTKYHTFYVSLFGSLDPQVLLNLFLLDYGDRWCSKMLSDYDNEDIVDILVVMFGDSWLKIKNALSTNYTVDGTWVETTTESVEKSYSAENNDSTENKSSIYGFDSQTATDSQEDNTSTDFTRDETREESKTINKSGSRGNVQGNILQELRVRKNNLIGYIMQDIASKLTYNIY